MRLRRKPRIRVVFLFVLLFKIATFVFAQAIVVLPERRIAAAVVISALSNASRCQILPIVKWSQIDDLDPSVAIVAGVIPVVMVVVVVVVRIVMMAVVLVLFLREVPNLRVHTLPRDLPVMVHRAQSTVI